MVYKCLTINLEKFRHGNESVANIYLNCVQWTVKLIVSRSWNHTLHLRLRFYWSLKNQFHQILKRLTVTVAKNSWNIPQSTEFIDYFLEKFNFWRFTINIYIVSTVLDCEHNNNFKKIQKRNRLNCIEMVCMMKIFYWKVSLFNYAFFWTEWWNLSWNEKTKKRRQH